MHRCMYVVCIFYGLLCDYPEFSICEGVEQYLSLLILKNMSLFIQMNVKGFSLPIYIIVLCF